MNLTSFKNTPPWARATTLTILLSAGLFAYHLKYTSSHDDGVPAILPEGVQEVAKLKPAALPPVTPASTANLPQLQGTWESVEKFEDMHTHYLLTLETNSYKLNTRCELIAIPTVEPLPIAKTPAAPVPGPQEVHGKWKLMPTNRYPLLELYPKNQQVTTVRRQLVAWTSNKTETTTFTSMAPKGGETMIWKKQIPQPQ